MDLTKNLNQQARIEDITLKEDFGTFVVTQEDDFGDMGSFALDMDTFMMSDLEKGRKVGDSMMAEDNNGGQNEMLDFFDETLNNQANVPTEGSLFTLEFQICFNFFYDFG